MTTPSAGPRLLVAAATLVAVGLGSRVQPPNLSGVWREASDSAAARVTVATRGDARFQRGTAGSGWGAPLTITQTGSVLTVEYQVFSAYDLQPPVHFTYRLDGAVSANTMMIGHSAAALTSHAAWVGDTLVITTTYPGPPAGDGKPIAVEVRQALHLEGAGRLVIETTRSGILGAAAETTRTTYRKS